MLTSLKRLAHECFKGLFITRVAVDSFDALAILLCELFQLCRAAGLSRDRPYLSHIIASKQRCAQCQADTSAGSAYQHARLAVQFGYQILRSMAGVFFNVCERTISPTASPTTAPTQPSPQQPAKRQP